MIDESGARKWRHRERQRLRLIDACISALHIYGPSRTTVEKVVALADLSPGIVRFYFDSKAAMLVASLEHLAAEFGERVLTPVARLKDNPVQALHLLVNLYLDADIELSSDSVRALVTAAGRPGVLACAPAVRLDLSGVRWMARRTHRVHDRLIAPNRALAGVGVYVLTEAGHRRVFPIPDIISDDGWVHGSFQPHERVVVSEAVSVVRPARTVRAHLKRRIRVRAGNEQLAAASRGAPEGRLGPGHLVRLVRRREVSPLDAGCYLVVLAADRALSRLRRGPAIWGSDGSSRTG